MNLEEIKNTISKYDELCNLTYEKIEILGNIDSRYVVNYEIVDIFYNFDKNICRIIYIENFDDNDNAIKNCFIFPLHYLTLSNDELKIVAKQDIEKILEDERIEKAEKISKVLQDKNNSEFEIYIKLKEKYEKNV